MLPELLELVDERVLQLVEGREHGIGEVLADMPEDLLGGIEFGTVGWQIKRMHVLGPNNLTTPIGPSPNSWRRCCKKSSRQAPSTVGNKRKTPVPVVGSTAA